MSSRMKREAIVKCCMLAGCVAALLLLGRAARADAVVERNREAGTIMAAAKLPASAQARAFAALQTAVYDAANAISARYPAGDRKMGASPGASLEAAVAAANHATLQKIVPSQQASIDAAYQAALATIADGPAKSGGIAVGEKAATAILALCAQDGYDAPDVYRPSTTPGIYVPTSTPAAVQWPKRKPWLMTRPDQFRPGPPPPLTSELWARDYNEIKAIGGKTSSRRTAEQTEIARFWEARDPPLYYGIVQAVANLPGRDATQNARLYAAVAQAMDDAFIAVFDAKYAYSFWRPVTAIRNGDTDGNDATERDPAWAPFIETPMHPEYPCAHCIQAATVGTVLQAEIGAGPTPLLSTTSPTANGATRTWTKVDDFVQEVAVARIYDGVHYRNSTQVAIAMGKQIGALAVAKVLRRPR